MNINELKFDNLHTDILEYIPQFLNFKNVLNLSQVSRNLFNSCLAFQKNYAIDRVNSYLKSVTVEEIRNCQMGNLSKLKICKNIFEVEVETIYKRVLIDLFINDSSNQRGKLFNERGKIVESFNSNFPLDYHTRKQISTIANCQSLSKHDLTLVFRDIFQKTSLDDKEKIVKEFTHPTNKENVIKVQNAIESVLSFDLNECFKSGDEMQMNHLLNICRNQTWLEHIYEPYICNKIRIQLLKNDFKQACFLLGDLTSSKKKEMYAEINKSKIHWYLANGEFRKARDYVRGKYELYDHVQDYFEEKVKSDEEDHYFQLIREKKIEWHITHNNSEEAFNIARKLKDVHAQDSAIGIIAKKTIELNQFEITFRAINMIKKDKILKNITYAKLAQKALEENQNETAFEAIKLITLNFDQRDVLIMQLLEKQKIDDFFKTFQLMVVDKERYISEFLRLFSKIIEHEETSKILHLIMGVPQTHLRLEFLNRFVEILFPDYQNKWIKYINECEFDKRLGYMNLFFEGMQNGFRDFLVNEDPFYADLLQLRLPYQNISKALDTVCRIDNSYERCFALYRVADFLHPRENFTEQLRVYNDCGLNLRVNLADFFNILALTEKDQPAETVVQKLLKVVHNDAFRVFDICNAHPDQAIRFNLLKETIKQGNHKKLMNLSTDLKMINSIDNYFDRKQMINDLL